ncbi:hypothetical protein LINGRAHAP2_LOCUS24153 [Linum grandiflorum]
MHRHLHFPQLISPAAAGTTTSSCNNHSTTATNISSLSFLMDFSSQSFSFTGFDQVSRFFRRVPIGDQLHDLYKSFFSRSNAPPLPPPSQNVSMLISSISPTSPFAID